jgi:hypothetical protein
MRIFIIVTIKFIAPAILEMPARCKLKIAKSTAGPECDIISDNGGYIVQPVPAPLSLIDAVRKSAKAGGNNQKLKLFNLGKAISGEPIKIGTIQLPNPPIRTGITVKKIIIIACEVTTVLYR